LVGKRLDDSLLCVVLTDDDGDRPCPIALFLSDRETQASEDLIPELSSLFSSAPKVCRPLAVKAVGLDGGPRLLSKVPRPGFDDSDSIAARSSWGLVAASSRPGLGQMSEDYT
jgi:hypothetical protein